MVAEQIQSEAVIQQLNLSYNKEQDRLLFRVGMDDDSEMMLWLTFRMARQLMNLLKVETHLPSAEDAKLEQVKESAETATEKFNKEVEASKALEKMDFKTEYQPREKVRSNKTLLATNIELITDESQHLNITCLEGMVVHINLNQALIIAICNMLQLSAKEASWDIGSNIAPAMVIEAERPEILH